MDYDYEVLERELAYKEHFSVYKLKLRHRLFGGGFSPVLSRELLDRGGAAGLIPYDPATDRVVMIEQFRVGTLDQGHAPWLLEFVAGLIEPGELPAAVAIREAHEEANIEVSDLVSVGRYYMSPGGSTELLHLYCGRVDAAQAGGVFGLPDEGEDIAVRVMSRAEAESLLDDGTPLPAWTALSIQWLSLNWQRLAQRWAG